MVKVKSAVGTVMDSVVYAVSDGLDKDFYLIDIGDYDAIRVLLPEGSRIRGVFITHGHHDHIVGLNQLKIQHPDCIVYSSQTCAEMLVSPKANLSAYLEQSFSFSGSVHILEDGDTVNLWDNVILTALATPGHNPSCMCFLLENYIFTGDSYISGSKVVTKLPGGNRILAQDGIKKILALAEGRVICPGHHVMVNGSM